MPHETLYELLGVTPTTPPAQIAAAIAARLAETPYGEQDPLLYARDTLLNPNNRESYDRLNALRGPLTPQERAATLAAAHLDVVVAEAPPDHSFAEILFTLYIALVAAILCLWIQALLVLVPWLAPEVAPILAWYGSEQYAAPVIAVFLSLIFGILAWFAFNLYDSALQATGKFLVVCGLIALAIALSFQTSGVGALGPIASLAVALPSILLGVALVRYLGQRDLDALSAIKPDKPKRKRPTSEGQDRGGRR